MPSLMIPPAVCRGQFEQHAGLSRMRCSPMSAPTAVPLTYSDRHGIFRKHDPEDDTPTQFQRALRALGIEGIQAMTPARSAGKGVPDLTRPGWSKPCGCQASRTWPKPTPFCPTTCQSITNALLWRRQTTNQRISRMKVAPLSFPGFSHSPHTQAGARI